jgi:hypothetical protein
VPVELALLPELMVSIALLLLLWAARALFGGMLSSMASRIPLLGRVLESAVAAIIADVVTAGESLARTAIDKAEGLILGPVFWIEHILADIWDTFDILRQVIAYVATTLLQLAVNLAVQEARVLIAAALATAENLISQVNSIIQGEFRVVYATIDQVEQVLEAYIQAEITAAEAYTTRAIDAETAYVTQVEQALSNEITSAITAETAFVQAEFASATAYTIAVAGAIDTTITTDVSAITAWVIDQVTSLSAAIDLVQTATVTLTLAQVQAVEADLGKLKADCTDNLCSGTGPLATLLNSLASAGWISVMLAYAAWGAADPRGCGNATAEVLGPIATGAKDLVTSAAGAF